VPDKINEFELLHREIKNIDAKITKELEDVKIDNAEIKANQQSMSTAIIRLADAVREIAVVQADIKIVTEKTENNEKQILKLFDLYTKIYEDGTSICKVRRTYLDNIEAKFKAIDRYIENGERIKEERNRDEDKKNFQVKLMLFSTILGWLFALLLLLLK